MASPVEFAGANTRLVAPEDRPDVQPLPVFRNGACVVSCWELTASERAEVERTGRVWLTVLSGPSSAPVFVGGEAEVRGVVAGHGPTWGVGEVRS